MCGIAGIVHLDGLAPVDERVLRRMNQTLVHRGPDDDGYLIDGSVGLAMRRLSIIDLSSGRQPIRNEDASIGIVFNGEIYTYRELARGLRSRGHTFSTATDTEVIVHLYEDYGPQCVEHLRGMFAFAIWDARTRTLLLARDRLGIKPLYYGVFDGQLLFGSELKALLANPVVRPEIDPRGLAAYLRYGYIADPLTILKGVRKLPPGHLLLVRGRKIEERRYWSIIPHLGADREIPDVEETREELSARLREAVKLRLVSDVPVGAFLSGGVDSSTVVALMAQELDHPVKTFSIGFEHQGFDELPYAREVSRRFATEHHELVLQPESVDELTKIVHHFDEPFGDPSALPTYFVSKLARESVKVVLSGDGGDELFGGYDRYLEHLGRRYAADLPLSLRRWSLRPMSRLLPEGMPGKRWLYNLSLPETERYLDSMSFFPPRLQRQLLDPEVWDALPEDEDGEHPSCPEGTLRGLSRIQAIDFQTYLPGDILNKVDRMSMAHSIEARVPLLDHELVEWVSRLPAELKVRGAVGKVLFKDVAERYLPQSIVHREKQGFAVPLQAWFKEELTGFLRELLQDSRTLQRGYFQGAGLKQFLERDPQARQPQHLWILAMLELWHRVVDDGR